MAQLSLGRHAARIWKPLMKGIQGGENVCNILMLFVPEIAVIAGDMHRTNGDGDKSRIIVGIQVFLSFWVTRINNIYKKHIFKHFLQV